MSYKFVDNLSKSEFNDFVYMHKYGTFFQSESWAQVKANWKPIYTGVYLDDELVGAALVLKRNPPIHETSSIPLR